MASVSFGGTNSGNQVGINHGTIHMPPERERPETPPAPLSTVPFRRDPDYVDRGTLLDQICEKGTRPSARIALVGLGGVGKSQLAIELSYRIREQSPKTWVFWIHAGSAARFEQNCGDIADRVKIPGRKDPSANIFKLIHDWLADERNGKWVLILDNVDDSRFLHEVPPSGRPLLEYLPVTDNGSTIITSRSRGVVSIIVEDADIIPIEPMDSSHATMLFEKKLRAQAEKESIIQLVTTLDCVPLAIVQAAGYIKQRTPRLSVPQYLKEFQKSDGKKTSLLNHNGGQLRRDRDAKNSILITWQLSFDHIQQSQPAAAGLLSLMSFFDRQGIPAALLQHHLAEGSDDNGESGTESSIDHDFEENIQVLRDYSMISISVDGATFEMHRLVQLAMRKLLEVHGQLQRWMQQFIEILWCEFPNGEFENWAVCQPLFSHIQSAVLQSPDDEGILPKWADLLNRAASFALTKGNVRESEALAVLAMHIRTKLFGSQHKHTIDSLEMAGRAYILSGKWEDAKTLQLEVIRYRKQVLGTEHPETLDSISNLASTYQYQGQWKEAEELNVQVIETSKQVLGPEHPDTLISISNLASTYQYQGRWKEAEELIVQVIEARKRVLGPEHPSTLMSISNLALTYQDQGQWKEAEELNVQVIETSKQVLGPEHPDTLISIGNLAMTYQYQRRLKEAEELEVQVIEARKRVLGPEHPSTLMSISNLALTYQDQGRLKEAEELSVQVIEARKQVLGPEHPDTLISISNLASTYQDQGRLKEAEELSMQVIEARKRVLGPEHPSTLMSISNLALTYQDQGRLKEAEELSVQVIEARKQVLRPEHPDTLISISNLASTYQDQGRLKEAEELSMQVIEARKRVLGPEHPDTLVSMNNLAHNWRSSGRLKAALQLMTECVRLRSLKLGPDHWLTLESTSILNDWRRERYV
ncbi:P-loop containing nucleoside triphosphate hydrolase protein [Penicillium pulvis]|uniref:P-loop containing nucleoside triphosphate hydrolase protein n=1 Tax=Penicillium pulvis TaxID=1562058 RepID=UPI0025491501|nr:P-loop containing nucleoside triphosphate hydrolase protein [Penicillium pulvis]KAJ5810568.1 P-loop containing nucleoside triphosphate hydrolase protein [Penicillium pulvis]